MTRGMTVRVASLPKVLQHLHAPAPEGPGEIVEALREELARTEDGAARALLLHQIGRLRECGGQAQEATQDYLEAVNLAPSNLAALEALIGLAIRRGSTQNLGPLLERLGRLAGSGSPRQEAFVLLAELQRRDGQWQEARQTIERWLEELPGDGCAWLALDLLASRTQDASLRERARTGRASTAHDSRWRALLLLDCASLRASAGDSATAFDLCRQAQDEHGSLLVLAEWERCAVALECWTEASQVAERAASFLRDRLGDRDALDASDVPSWQRSADHVALLMLRAAEWARREGHLERALELFDRCVEARPSESLPRVAQLLCRRDGPEGTSRARHLQAEIERIGPGPVAAALWLDLADGAARAGDTAEQRRAVEAALHSHPNSLRVRALHLDLLERAGSAAETAAALANLAQDMGPAGADWFLAAALITARPDPTGIQREQRVEQVGALLQEAADAGAAAGVVAHVRSIVAHLLGDTASFEAALDSLAQVGPVAVRVDAALGLARSRLLSQLRQADADALLGSLPVGLPVGLSVGPSVESSLGPSAILPHGHEDHPVVVLLRTVVLPLWTRHRRAEDGAAWTLTLATTGPLPARGRRTPACEDDDRSVPALTSLRRATTLLTIRRWLEGDDLRAAHRLLQELMGNAEGDLTASALLADVLAPTAPDEAAAVLVAAARHPGTPPEIRAAWLLRAGRWLWQTERRAAALATIREAEPLAPEGTGPWLEWGARRLDPDDPANRARLLEDTTGDRAQYSELERLTLAARRGELTREPGLGAPGSEVSGAAGSGDEAEGLLRTGELWLNALLRAAYSSATEEEPWLALTALPGAPPGLGPALRYAALAAETDRSPSEVVSAAERWAREATGSLDAALAWLVASREARDLEGEIAARSELARRLDAPELTAAAALLARLTGSARREQLAEDVATGADAAPPDSPRARALHWAALELTPPRGDDARRARALARLAEGTRSLPPGVGGAEGSAGSLLVMAGFGHLRAGDTEAAVTAFSRVTELLPDDLGAWEGLRAAALAQGDRRLEAEACTELARRTHDARRAAAFWERAGVLHQENLGQEEQAEEAFASALAQDFSRETAFERLYLIVRGKGDEERLLDLLEGRLGVVDEPRRIAELLWEKARLTRKLGRNGPALRALEQLLGIHPEHLGALALSSELCLRERLHERAATCLVLLADLEQAPARQRLLSGLAAADLFEQKLGRPEQALNVLRALRDAGLGDAGLADAENGGDVLAERLGFCALRAGHFEEAAAAFEVVLARASSAPERAAAAAFLLALYRDQLPPSHPERRELASQAARALLAERPTDPDALTFLMDEVEAEEREPLLRRALDELRRETHGGSSDAAKLELLARLASEIGERRTALAAHGSLHLLGRLGADEIDELAAFSRRFPPGPRDTSVLAAPDLTAIASPRDAGPFLSVASRLPAACIQCLEPGLHELRVRPAQRSQDLADFDPALDGWARVFGLESVTVRRSTLADRVFVAGRSEPTLVLGDELRSPLDERRRARAVGALYTLARGSAPFVQRDEETAARMMAGIALAVGAVGLARALASDEERVQVLGDELRARLDDEERSTLLEVLRKAPEERAAFSTWYWGARLSALRAGALALGEPSHLRGPLEELRAEWASSQVDTGGTDPFQTGLVAFTLSPVFVRLREALGLEDA